MKFRNTFLFAVLLLFVNKVQTNDKGLKAVIEKLAPIARLTNGIAIQTELSTNPSRTSEIVAEFLGVPSGGDLENLKKMNVEELSTNFASFHTKFESFPGLKVKDVTALKSSLDLLKDMKTHIGVLKTSVTDPSTDLENKVNAAKSLKFETFYTEVSTYSTTSDTLKSIQNTNYGSLNQAVALSDYLLKLKVAVSEMPTKLNYLSDYKTSEAPLLALHNIHAELKSVSEFVEIAQQLFRNAAQFKNLKNDLNLLSGDVASLTTVLDVQKFSSQLSSGLGHVISSATNINKVDVPVKSWTIAFENGIGDLDVLMSDLKTNEALSTLIAEGQDTKSLISALGLLSAVQEKVKILQRKMEELRKVTNETTLSNVNQYVKDASKANVKSEKTAKMQADLKSISSCVEKLVLPPATPDFKAFDELMSFAERLEKQVLSFQKILAEVTAMSDYPKHMAKVESLKTTLAGLNISWSSMATTDLWNSIDSDTEIAPLAEFLNTVYSKMKDLGNENPFKTVKEAVDWKSISTALHSLDGTNLVDTLECLQKTAYEEDEIDKLVSFGASVQVVKSKNDEMKVMKECLESMVEVKKGVLEVDKTVSSKKTVSRRRRAGKPKFLANLKDAKEVSVDLGRGVAVLQEFGKILNNQDSVLVAANAKDPLKSEIDGIQGAQAEWTDAKRAAMGVMVTDLNALEKFASTLKKSNLSSVWTIFDEAGPIKGVQIDAKVFEDPISKVLELNSNQDIKAKSGDFKKIGSLNLDFSTHHVHLQKASQTLKPLQTFFDDYFGLGKNIAGAQASVQSTAQPSDPNYLLLAGGAVGGIALIAGVVTGGWFLLKHLIQKNRWKNRERYWLYEGVFLDHQDDDWFKAVEYGKVATTKRLISEGRCLDVYKKHPTDLDYYTPLHMAVRHCHPKVVELLIRAGADRSFLSSKANETAEQLMERLMNDDKTIEAFDKKKLLQIKPIFKKYEKKKFQPQVKSLLPLELFTVGLFQRNSNEDFPDIYSAFVRKYESSAFLDVDENNRAVTHVVFDTEPDGSLNLNELGRNALAEAVEAICSKRILVRTAWLTECLKNRNNFYKDYEYRITTVKLKIKLYESVDTWQKWTNSRHIPSLLGVIVVVDVDESINKRVKGMVSALGATVIDHEIFGDENAKIEPPTKPYWFPDQQRYWYVCDMWKTESVDVKYAHHKKNMRILILEEFFEKLLGMFGPPDRKPDNGLKQGQKSATGSTQASTNSNVSQV